MSLPNVFNLWQHYQHKNWQRTWYRSKVKIQLGNKLMSLLLALTNHDTGFINTLTCCLFAGGIRSWEEWCHSEYRGDAEAFVAELPAPICALSQPKAVVTWPAARRLLPALEFQLAPPKFVIQLGFDWFLYFEVKFK